MQARFYLCRERSEVLLNALAAQASIRQLNQFLRMRIFIISIAALLTV
jgi:hypothetical protein